MYTAYVMSEQNGSFKASIIGAGAVGEYHINAQEQLGSEVVIFEPNNERAEAASRRHGGLVLARTLEEAIELADVVHICTPHRYHAEGALASIALGKPTIIEKPLTIKLDESIDIYKAATGSEVPVIVGTSFRLTPPFLRIKEGLQKGDIGELISLETTYLHDMSRVQVGNDWRRSPDRGSFLYGGGSHAVDLNMWLAGQPVTEVQARIGGKKVRSSYPGDEDFDLSIGYSDGTTGRVWLSAAAPLPAHGADVKVYGTEGAYRAHNKNPNLGSYHDGDSGWTTEPVGLRHTINDMSAIFNAYIRGERLDFEPLPGVEEGLKVMVTLQTLEQAAESGYTERVPTLDEVLAPIHLV